MAVSLAESAWVCAEADTRERDKKIAGWLRLPDGWQITISLGSFSPAA